jgi:hypothetical protein
MKYTFINISKTCYTEDMETQQKLDEDGSPLKMEHSINLE